MKIDLSFCDPDQTAAILETGKRDILVSASAGAGKTRVLVNRIMKRCLQDHIPLQRILALTFTDAAAQEMKNRLSSSLHDALKICPEEEKEYIQQQIAGISSADITTIDSFCLSLIRKYYSAIGLNPACGSNILTSAENESYYYKAYIETLKEISMDDQESLLDLLSSFSVRSEDFDSLYTAVRSVIDTADSCTDPENWYAEAQMTYPASGKCKDIPSSVLYYFFRFHTDGMKEVSRLLSQLVTEGTSSENEELLSRMQKHTEQALAEISKGLSGYSRYRAELKKIAGVPLKKVKNGADEKIRKSIFEALDPLMECAFSLQAFEANGVLMHQRTKLLLFIAQKTSEKACNAKAEDACLEFADMERYAYRILSCQDTAVTERIRSSYDEVMIDEFQDTSTLQDAILKLAAGSTPVFRVGDVKQSIYRFRQAKPQLFRNLLHETDSTVFRLMKNYRSDEQIIAFTNLLFSRLMNVEGAEDTYGTEDVVTHGAAYQAHTSSEPAVKLVIIKSDSFNGPNDDKISKADWIARKIIEMMNLDPSLKYKDFAVLTRSHLDQIALDRGLKRAGIPSAIDTREGFFNSDLCLTIAAVLRYIYDRSDAVSLMTLLTSPMYSWSDEYIAQGLIRMRKEKHIEGNDLCAFVQVYHPEIITQFDHLLDIAMHRTAAELLTAVSCITSEGSNTCFYDSLSIRDKANFDYLLEQTSVMKLNSPFDLIQEMENSIDDHSSEACNAGKDDDVVRSATIHGSKGLQYKYVFLWGTSGSKSHHRSSFMTDELLHIGMNDADHTRKSVIPTIQSIALKEKITAEDLEEFTRLLYVAVTRAEKQLYIVDMDAGVIERQPITMSLLKKRRGLTGLITAALDHDEGINENGLLEVICCDSVHAASVSLPSIQAPVFTVPVLQDIPEIRTPSSYENREESYVLPSLNFNEAGMSYGTRIHKVLEILPDDRRWTRDILLEADAELTSSDIERLLAFDQSPLRQRTLAMQIFKEYPFYYEDQDIRLNGTIDYLAVSDTEVLLIDYKTDNKSIDEIRELYADQINAYCRALASIYPDRRIEAYIYSLRNSAEIRMK